jgi:tryptophan synthase beta chain
VGIFQGFLDDESVDLIGVEAGGDGDAEGRHASRIAINGGIAGVAQGYRTFFVQNEDGQLARTHSVAAGLDYVGVSPILADLADRKRARFTSAKDAEVVEAVAMLAAKEGIIPALESAHAVAALIRESSQYTSDDVVVVNVSGRGDKDIFTVAKAFGDEGWYAYLKDLVKEPSE